MKVSSYRLSRLLAQHKCSTLDEVSELLGKHFTAGSSYMTWITKGQVVHSGFGVYVYITIGDKIGICANDGRWRDVVRLNFDGTAAPN